MQTLALPLIPALAGIGAFFLRSDTFRRGLLVATALVHAALTAGAWRSRPPEAWSGWLYLDTTGMIFLSIISTLFLVAACYTVGYLSRERQRAHLDFQEGFVFTNEPEAVFTSCLLLFLASMTFVVECQHFGLLWVGVEATTLASAPLIFFHRQHRSLEATWKYLLICSVGIAIALLGNFLLAVAATTPPDVDRIPLVVGALVAHAKHLDALWLKGAFVLILVGYGTKMGLAPMHTWLPDAHSESPSAVSALLSGALLNCAFLGILRIHQVCIAAGQGQFSQQLLVLFGLLSMAIAGIFILRQTDYKRMLAYSSVEHMGILALGIGLGGAGVFGALLHAVNHSVTKAMLFMAAGNIVSAFGTKACSEVRGLSRVLPYTSTLWIIGFLAITGTPPFGVFLSEFTILGAALNQGRGAIAGIYLVLLALIFMGMATIFLGMTQGKIPVGKEPDRLESFSMILPPAVLAIVVFVLGWYIPPTMLNALQEAARDIQGGT